MRTALRATLRRTTLRATLRRTLTRAALRRDFTANRFPRYFTANHLAGYFAANRLAGYFAANPCAPLAANRFTNQRCDDQFLYRRFANGFLSNCHYWLDSSFLRSTSDQGYCLRYTVLAAPMQVLAEDGARIDVRVSGDKRAPAVVLLHGFPLTREIWDAQSSIARRVAFRRSSRPARRRRVERTARSVPHRNARGRRGGSSRFAQCRARRIHRPFNGRIRFFGLCANVYRARYGDRVDREPASRRHAARGIGALRISHARRIGAKHRTRRRRVSSANAIRSTRASQCRPLPSVHMQSLAKTRRPALRRRCADWPCAFRAKISPRTWTCRW